jgi:hypothetical protein
VQILYNNGIPSETRLRWKLLTQPNFLETVGFDFDDCLYLRSVMGILEPQPDCPLPAAPKFIVGDRIILEDESFTSDLEGGPLRPGDTGTVVAAESTSRYYIKADTGLKRGKESWYASDNIRLATPVDIARASSTLSVREPLAVGSRVRILHVSSTEAQFRQQGRNKFTSNMAVMLGKCGVIVGIDSNGFCEVSVEGFAISEYWSPFLVELVLDIPKEPKVTHTSFEPPLPKDHHASELNDSLVLDNTEVKFSVGDFVTVVPSFVNIADAAGGPLKLGDVGEIVKDDKSSKPFQVKAVDGRVWWYTANALRKSSACETKLALSPARFRVHDRVTLAAIYKSVSDAAGGPLREGDVGVIISDDGSHSKPFQVSFESKAWWYDAAALSVVGASTPAATTFSQQSSSRLKLHESVRLSADYQQCGDAKDGPLHGAATGVIVEDDRSGKPFKVEVNGRSWWYEEAALCRATNSSDTLLLSGQGTLAVGNQVRIRNNSSEFVATLQSSVGGFHVTMMNSLGTIGVVCSVDADGNCDVAGISVHRWHRSLLELIQARLRVGDRVTVVHNYASVGDAASGPLNIGDEAVISQDDLSGKPYQVRCKDGRTWWYGIKALRRL